MNSMRLLLLSQRNRRRVVCFNGGISLQSNSGAFSHGANPTCVPGSASIPSLSDDSLMGHVNSVEWTIKVACWKQSSARWSNSSWANASCHLYSTAATSTVSISSYTETSECLALVTEPQNKKEVADLFRKWGCSDSDIRKIFLRQPSLEKANISNLDPKLNLLLGTLGLSASDLVKIINCRPHFLAHRITHGFSERMDYLQAVFQPRELLLKAITRNPSLLLYDYEKVVKPVISLYEQIGVDRKDLIPLFISRPTILTRTNLTEEKIQYINRIGLSAESKLYKYLVAIVGISRMETILEKVANLEKFGVSKHDVMRLIRRSPMVLTLSTDKVQRNMTFTVGTMKLPAEVTLEHPYLLYCNLEGILKPRALLAGKIQEMNLCPQIKGPNLIRAMRMKEKRFLNAFVTCHPKDISDELMEYYENAKCIKRLAEGSRRVAHHGFPF
ncbi:hypothetical protein Droror1_Dr00016956 [Drosera rotundifolia]